MPDDLFHGMGEHAMTPTERRHMFKRVRKNGYAAPPGTGPKGETCKTCKHIFRNRKAKTYLKCGLMQAAWTGGAKTDILAGAQACSKWEKPE